MYAEGAGVPRNYDEAMKWYRKAAEQGEAFAQSNLGFMYENGKGVPQNYDEAMVPKGRLSKATPTRRSAQNDT
jgi:TPR repeat protein